MLICLTLRPTKSDTTIGFLGFLSIYLSGKICILGKNILISLNIEFQETILKTTQKNPHQNGKDMFNKEKSFFTNA